jgi:WXG100 family type VII secretion target
MDNSGTYVTGTTRFNVTLADVKQAHGSTVQVAANVKERLDKLQRDVEALAHSWRGVAHDHFHLYMVDWSRLANQLHHALVGIADGLAATERNYYGSEDQNVRNVARMQSELPPARI